jgi:hypothetical protein
MRQELVCPSTEADVIINWTPSIGYIVLHTWTLSTLTDFRMMTDPSEVLLANPGPEGCTDVDGPTDPLSEMNPTQMATPIDRISPVAREAERGEVGWNRCSVLPALSDLGDFNAQI